MLIGQRAMISVLMINSERLDERQDAKTPRKTRTKRNLVFAFLGVLATWRSFPLQYSCESATGNPFALVSPPGLPAVYPTVPDVRSFVTSSQITSTSLWISSVGTTSPSPLSCTSHVPTFAASTTVTGSLN